MESSCRIIYISSWATHRKNVEHATLLPQFARSLLIFVFLACLARPHDNFCICCLCIHHNFPDLFLQGCWLCWFLHRNFPVATSTDLVYWGLGLRLFVPLQDLEWSVIWCLEWRFDMIFFILTSVNTDINILENSYKLVCKTFPRFPALGVQNCFF